VLRHREGDVPLRLAGFATGGGFALRFAGGAPAHLFDRYLLLAPSLTYHGPMFRPPSEGAAEVRLFSGPYVPRLIGLAAANAEGVHAFDGLPVIAFAVAPDL
jgi:alpha-beta hydrolase superfamily lysophospholipase